MKTIEDITNKILSGNTLEVLKTIPNESIDCVVTSPPYFGLRSYKTNPQVWGGKEGCQHVWGDELKRCGNEYRNDKGDLNGNKYEKIADLNKANSGNFCSVCGAWRGELGLEPSYQLYLDHLWQICDEIKRVLKKTGVMFWNIGDSYNNNASNSAKSNLGNAEGLGQLGRYDKVQSNIPVKSLMGIPERFVIGMSDRGWIRRNTICWYKRNCMPDSADDRFTVDFEYIFYFTKSNSVQYWVNKKTLKIVDKQPLGVSGVEGQDWGWKDCPNCKEAECDTKISKEDSELFSSPRARIYRNSEDRCSRCEGTGKIKYSFWSGNDYYFEQQFESLNIESLKRECRGNNENKYSKDEYFPEGVHANTMSQPRKYKGYDNLEEEYKKRNGRNMRTVWDITTKSFSGAHFAVFAPEIPERCINAGCPKEVCSKCGLPREKIYKVVGIEKVPPIGGVKHVESNQNSAYSGNTEQNVKEFNSYSDCGCGEKFNPGIVLDPFMGAGTTGMVAKQLGRNYVGIELNPEYIKIAEKRIKDSVCQLSLDI